MMNSADFSKRMQKIMDRNDLNASSFAERINVGRSSISHILSGRNKPSLDFVIHTVKEFPEVDFDWLLNGKGTYPKSEVPLTPPTQHSPPAAAPEKKTMEPSRNEPVQKASPNLFSTSEHQQNIPTTQIKKGKNIQKVILLYDDGSFEYFIP